MTIMISMRTLAATTIIGLICSASFALAADWPQWHGPNRDNFSTETGLLKTWPADGPTLAWRATGLGGGFSTPSIAQGKVYGGGYIDSEEVVWALDAGSGKQIWRVNTGPATTDIGHGEGTRSSPVVADNRLYILGPGGRLVCLETATGKEVWRKELAGEFGGRMMSGWGFSESPLVDGDAVICTPGSANGTVLALNKQTGAMIWQSRDFTDKAAYASIVIGKPAGVRQYVVFTGQNVAGIDPATGKTLWKASRPGKTAIVPTPIIDGDHVFVTSGYGIGCNLFKVSKSATGLSAEQIYANTDLVNHHGGVVKVGNYIYGHSDSKGWVCLDFKTGNVVWSNPGVGKGAVTYADGHLYCRSEKGAGTVALIAATPDGYKQISQFDQPDRSKKNSWPHPVIANGRLYLRDQDVLLCYNVSSR